MEALDRWSPIGGRWRLIGGGLVEAHHFGESRHLQLTKSHIIFATGQMEPLGVELMQITFNNPLFELGQVVATHGATEAMQGELLTAALLLDRHSSGDWGNVCEEDAQLNDEAVKIGNRIMSVYTLDGGTKVWIITEWDRSATTILLPEEY